MKKIMLFAAAVAMAASFSSCKKCSTCVVKDSGTSVYTYPEQCGKKSDIENYKKACETAYSAYGYSCECSDK